MESEFFKFITKHYEVKPRTIKITGDNGETIWAKLDFGDDEVICVAVDRKKNGYRIISEC